MEGKTKIKYNTFMITFEGHFGNADLKSGREVTPGQVSSFGVPMTLDIATT